MFQEGDDDATNHPGIRVVLQTYHELRKKPRKAVSWKSFPWTVKNSQTIDAVETIKSVMKEQSLTTPGSAHDREKLLIEATKQGCICIVQELLCPSSSSSSDNSSTNASHVAAPVSLRLKEEKTGNSILHLAVLSGKRMLVRWLSRHVDKMDFDLKSECLGGCNNDLETPFSLAIRSGNIKLIKTFMKSVYYAYFCSIDGDLMETKLHSIGHHDLYDEYRSGVRSMGELKSTINTYGSSKDRSGGAWSRMLLSLVAMLDARNDACNAVKNVIDNWSRPIHLQQMSLKVERNCAGINGCQGVHSLKSVRTLFDQGLFAPWWDSELSEFHQATYFTGRSQEDLEKWFSLVENAIQIGEFEIVLWLFEEWKAPPSLLACISDDFEFDGEWYWNDSKKLMESAVIGWTHEAALDIEKSDGRSEGPYKYDIETVIGECLGSRVSSRSEYHSSYLKRRLWTVDLGNDVSVVDANHIWRRINNEAPKEERFSGEQWYGVLPKHFAAIKLACSLPQKCFNDSSQARILKYFLEQIYDKDCNLVAADLPNLSKFVVLDHLPFFRFLTEVCEPPFLDLQMPLLWPLTSMLSSHGDDNAVAIEVDGQDECPICYESMTDPFILKCGHRFHYKCLLGFFFPNLKDRADDNIGNMTNELLAKYPHLSLTLGKQKCPYCRQAVKPALKEAFALNLLDGVRRSQDERRKCPHSPHLDLRRNQIDITVGQALLAFSACAGAIKIFQWLVNEKGVNVMGVKVGGFNVMQHAVMHGQILIIRWLFRNGYSAMIRGDMNNDTFTTFTPGLRSANDALDLDDQTTSERINFWKKELKLSNLSGRDSHEYTDTEWEFLSEFPTQYELEIIAFQQSIERASPVHYLLMNSLDICDSYENHFFKALRSSFASAVVPKNWYQLVLDFGTNKSMRSDAKAFMATEVLCKPDGIESRLQSQQRSMNAKHAISAMEDVLSGSHVMSTMPRDISRSQTKYNMWDMLLRGEKDWRHFFEVACWLNVWDVSTMYEWFKDRENHRHILRSFVEHLIMFDRVDVITAFSSMSSFCNECGFEYGREPFDIFAAQQGDKCGWSSSPRAVALRPIIQRQQKSTVFAPFLERIDLVRKCEEDHSELITKVAKLVIAGADNDKIEHEVDFLREVAISLSGRECPLGTGTSKSVLEKFNLSRIDWLAKGANVDGKSQQLLDVFISLENPKIAHWMFARAFEYTSLTSKNENYSDDFLFLKKASNAVVHSNHPSALHELVAFCCSPNSPTMYRNQRKRLMKDLLVAKRTDANDHTIDTGFFRDVLFLIYARARHTSREYSVERTKIEDAYSLVHWLFGQAEVAELMSTKEDFAASLEDMVRSMEYVFGGAPYEAFRMLNLISSYGFDLRDVRCDGKDLLSLMFEWGRERVDTLTPEVRQYLSDSGHYQDSNGVLMLTKKDLVGWLALEAKITLQHMHYLDTKSSWDDKTLLSEEEFNALKAKQIDVLNGNSN